MGYGGIYDLYGVSRAEYEYRISREEASVSGKGWMNTAIGPPSRPKPFVPSLWDELRESILDVIWSFL